MTTRATADPAAVRSRIYTEAVLTAARELVGRGAEPVEVSAGVMTAAIELLVGASGSRDLARRALIAAADSMLDYGVH